jgi:hypothetical protein
LDGKFYMISKSAWQSCKLRDLTGVPQHEPRADSHGCHTAHPAC